MSTNIEVYSPGLVLGQAYSEQPRSAADAVGGLKVASGAPHRYTLRLPALPRGASTTLSFSSDTSDEAAFHVSVPVDTGRRFRRRQWRQLRVLRPANEAGGGPAVSASAYELLDGPQRRVLVLTTPSTADWMGSVPDATRLGDLTLPGTHESCALYGYPISQCQQPSTDISQQLLDGVRFFDVRLRAVGDELLTYHGPRPQRSSLRHVLDTVHGFLASHPTETLILCLKEETPPAHPAFSELVYEHFRLHGDEWFVENRIPQLGEVRGKGILMTRFAPSGAAWAGGMGVHPSTWPDSRREGFTWDCAGTPFRIQDWYRVQSFLEIPEKFQVIVNHLGPTLDADPAHPFSLSYTTAASFPLALPTTFAKGFGWPDGGMGVYGVNQRLARWLLQRISEGKRVRACLAVDFYRESGEDRGLAGLLVSMNFL